MDDPKYLYKYRYFDEDGYHLDILRNLELYFASPSELNDPFDCKIPSRFDLLSQSELASNLVFYIKTQNPSLHPNKVIKLARERAKEYLESDDLEVDRNKLLEFHDENYGICSFSKKENHNALWSLYSDTHQGFCILFDNDKLSEYFNSFSLNQIQIFRGGATIIRGVNVNYESKMPIFKPIIEKDGSLKNAMLPISTKSLDWNHESEFRYFTYSLTNISIPIPKGSIIKVIAGIKVTPDNLLLLQDICASKDIPLVKALKNPLSFKASY